MTGNLFSSVHVIFTNIDHILSYKTNLRKILKNQNYTYSENYGIKLETNIRKISVRSPSISILKNTILNNPKSKKKSQRKSEIIELN